MTSIPQKRETWGDVIDRNSASCITGSDGTTWFDQRPSHRADPARPHWVRDADEVRQRAWKHHDELCDLYLQECVEIDEVNEALKEATEAEDYYLDELNRWRSGGSPAQLILDHPLVDACPDDERWQMP